MNESLSRIVALLAVWVIALLPLLLLDRASPNLVPAFLATHFYAAPAQP